MNVERLTHLRDLLRADAANPQGVRFDLGVWASPRAGDPSYRLASDPIYITHELRDVEVVNAPTMSCDTFACALGLACLDPVFQAQGLRFTVSPRGNGQSAWMIPTFGTDDTFAAGAAFFDIDIDDSEYLFDPSCYDGTPKEAEGELFVAQRVDDFLNGYIDENYHTAYTRDTEEDEDDA